jgi:Peptidase inhibitor family I36
MNRKFLTVIGGLGALGALVLGPAGAALASPAATAASASSCPQGYFCIYTAPNFGGTMYKYDSSVANLPSGIINKDESFVNTTILSVRLYFGANFGNPHTCMPGNGEGGTVAGNLLTPIHFYFNSDETAGAPREYIYENVHGFSMSSTECTGSMFSE